MSNSGGTINNVTGINERLYVDRHFRRLQCKGSDSPEEASVLRDLLRQVDVHCTNLNVSLNSAEKFKCELYNDYCDIVDNTAHPGLLPVLSETKNGQDNNRNFSVDKFQQNKMKSALQDLNTHLDNLKLNLPCQKQNSLMKKTVATAPYQMTKTNILPQSKSYSAKRAASENESSTVEHVAKKTNRWLSKNKPPVQSKSEPSKSPGTGFMSASSMYRNPLKKANEEPKPNEPDSNTDSEQNHESLKHFDKKITDVIFNEIMDFSPNIKWSDIAGLDFVKTTVQEIVIWPLLRPDIFTGLRAPPRGILLFGPPGTGKTLIGKCIATESNSTFFCISASSLASKWVGESEQLVRALFTVANLNQPAVIFIDEIDSLLSQRSDKDQDFSRKLKTEFLVQFDGAKTSAESRVLVVGATNRPHELDEAARRRFVKRLYVPLPEESGRRQIVQKLLGAHQHNLSETDMQRICDETNGYSGSDVSHLCKEAAMGPIRCIGPENIKTVSLDQVRPIILNDFLDALRQVRASVAQDDLNYYLEWNKKFGSFGV